MRIIVRANERNPRNIPGGFRTFKCQAPGCRRMAQMQVRTAALKHLGKQGTRCFCHEHGQAERDAAMDVYPPSDWPSLAPLCASDGQYLMRRRQDAFGGYRGWEYAEVVTEEDNWERQNPNPWAVRDGDGNYIIRD